MIDSEEIPDDHKHNMGPRGEGCWCGKTPWILYKEGLATDAVLRELDKYEAMRKTY